MPKTLSIKSMTISELKTYMSPRLMLLATDIYLFCKDLEGKKTFSTSRDILTSIEEEDCYFSTKFAGKSQNRVINKFRTTARFECINHSFSMTLTNRFGTASERSVSLSLKNDTYQMRVAFKSRLLKPYKDVLEEALFNEVVACRDVFNYAFLIYLPSETDIQIILDMLIQKQPPSQNELRQAFRDRIIFSDQAISGLYASTFLEEYAHLPILDKLSFYYQMSGFVPPDKVYVAVASHTLSSDGRKLLSRARRELRAIITKTNAKFESKLQNYIKKV